MSFDADFELDMSLSYGDEYDDFDDAFEDDDFDYEDDDTLDEYDDEADMYDDDMLTEDSDDFDEPYDDYEPEDGYVHRTSDGEELIDEDDLAFDDEL